MYAIVRVVYTDLERRDEVGAPITAQRVSFYDDEDRAHAAARRLADKNQDQIDAGHLDYIVEPVPPNDKLGRRKVSYGGNDG
jgi:hypothetical protein